MKFSKLGLVGSLVAASMLTSGVALAVDTATVNVSAAVASKCAFTTNTGTMSFALDPSVGTDVPGTVSAPVFWCTKGLTYNITDDDGIHESGTTHRMQHASVLTEFIPYSFTYTQSGTGGGAGVPNRITLNLTGTVLGSDYINAQFGNYADTVTLTLNP
jgi:spore coat protein U-like protein